MHGFLPRTPNRQEASTTSTHYPPGWYDDPPSPQRPALLHRDGLVMPDSTQMSGAEWQEDFVDYWVNEAGVPRDAAECAAIQVGAAGRTTRRQRWVRRSARSSVVRRRAAQRLAVGEAQDVDAVGEVDRVDKVVRCPQRGQGRPGCRVK